MTVNEFGHVSEFYQTITTVFLFGLVILQAVSFFFDIYQKLTSSQLKAHKQQIQWTKQKSQSLQQHKQQPNQTTQQNQLQKSVSIYVQNEITNMEKNLQEQKSQKKNVQHNQHEANDNTHEKEQIQNGKSIRFYYMHIAFNNFISEKMAILIPLLVLGILTQSTFVYSLAAFFFCLLCSLLNQYLDAQEKLIQKYKQSPTESKFSLKSLVKIIETLVIMSIFLSYWVIKQFDA